MVRTASTAKADYGYDAPGAILALALSTLALLIVTIVVALLAPGWWWLIPAAYTVYCGLSTASYRYTTRRGKRLVWEQLLDGIALRGNERALDLGCGRGAVLTLAAHRLPAGCSIGVDLWRSVDQSGNDPTVVRANIEAEGVARQTRLITADMRALPLATEVADLVVSSVVVHNISDAAGRTRAVAEAARLLRPGGQLLIVDIRHTAGYAQQLRALGLRVTQRPLGWRFWYGSPMFAGSLVHAVKP
jgi:arsenite methyltransferase